MVTNTEAFRNLLKVSFPTIPDMVDGYSPRRIIIGEVLEIIDDVIYLKCKTSHGNSFKLSEGENSSYNIKAQREWCVIQSE